MRKEYVPRLLSMAMIILFCLWNTGAGADMGCPLALSFRTASALFLGDTAGINKQSTPSNKGRVKTAYKSPARSVGKRKGEPTALKHPAQGPESKVIALSPKTITPVDVKAIGDYTGLIIDATGLKVERSMSPKIRRVDGSVVWAGEDADPDFVIDKGIVGYATTMAAAKVNPRAGANPLIIRAVMRYGGDNFHSDPEISKIDAERLLQFATKDGFLKKFHVIFLID